MQIREIGRKKRHLRIRKKIKGTPERPRLCVHRSAKHLYAQVIDDMAERTLFSFSTADKDFVEKNTAVGGKIAKAAKLGEHYGKILIEKGIRKIAFDRGGYLYHGRVKALAESLRQAGLEF